MKKMNKILLTVVIILLFLFGIAFLTGCKVNPAAENFSNLVFKHHEQVIVNHEKLSDGEKELLMIALLQTQGLNQHEINTKIDEYRKLYDWHKLQSRPQLE